MAKRLYITLGLLGFLTVTVSSQVVRPIGLLGPLKNWASETPAGEALIKGAAVDMNNTPLANAPVRLRNLLSNKIEQSSFADQAGEFTPAIREVLLGGRRAPHQFNEAWKGDQMLLRPVSHNRPFGPVRTKIQLKRQYMTYYDFY